MSEIIKVENLVKTYGSIVAVNGISFTVEKGSLFAFLGTNGAGKSTTIDVLSIHRHPVSGKSSIANGQRSIL